MALAKSLLHGMSVPPPILIGNWRSAARRYPSPCCCLRARWPAAWRGTARRIPRRSCAHCLRAECCNTMLLISACYAVRPGGDQAHAAVSELSGQQRGEAQLGGVRDYCVLATGEPQQRGCHLCQPCQVHEMASYAIAVRYFISA